MTMLPIKLFKFEFTLTFINSNLKLTDCLAALVSVVELRAF